jgi:hypothetical protein
MASVSRHALPTARGQILLAASLWNGERAPGLIDIVLRAGIPRSPWQLIFRRRAVREASVFPDQTQIWVVPARRSGGQRAGRTSCRRFGPPTASVIASTQSSQVSPSSRSRNRLEVSMRAERFGSVPGVREYSQNSRTPACSTPRLGKSSNRVG